MEPDQALAHARTALARGDVDAAQEALAQVPDDDPAGYEVRAQVAYAAGNLEGCLSAWERLHHHLVASGDGPGSAHAACMVGLYLLIDTGLMTPVRAWVRRAEAALSRTDGEQPAAALVAMIKAYERFMSGDPEAARDHAREAVEIGGRTGVLAAVVMGRIATARLEILDGRIEQGLAALDDVGLLLTSGELDPLTTGMAYCELICAAQGMLLLERAREWTDVMERWGPGRAVGAIHGRCLVHRAELLRISGPADQAEQAAEDALTHLRPWLRREFGWPLVELGAIRLRRGDLEGAEEALLAAHERAWCPQPALALLRLEQGDPDTAAALIAEAIARPVDIPWKERPPIGDLRLFPFYDAQCEIASARGDLGTATSAADELARIAAAYPGPGLEAAAALAAARTAALAGDAGTALRAAATAVATWSDLEAPYELAQARLVLATAHAQAGNTLAAGMERHAAAQAFRAYGASDRATRAEADQPPQVPGSRVGSLSVTGNTVTLTFGGRTSHVRDLVGLRTLRRLLAEPGREFHVLDLTGATAGAGHPAPNRSEFTLETGLPIIDNQAKAAYRRRLTEIEEDIADAEATGDQSRLELARSDRDFLAHELAAAVGLGGRNRRTGDVAERARTSVTRSLRYALRALAENDPTLAEHLRLHLRTGTYCCYRPDPVSPVRWEISAP